MKHSSLWAHCHPYSYSVIVLMIIFMLAQVYCTSAAFGQHFTTFVEFGRVSISNKYPTLDFWEHNTMFYGVIYFCWLNLRAATVWETCSCGHQETEVDGVTPAPLMATWVVSTLWQWVVLLNITRSPGTWRSVRPYWFQPIVVEVLANPE